MITFMVLFFPAVISLCLYEILTRSRPLSYIQRIYVYVIANLVINFTVFCIKCLLGTANNTLYNINTANDISPLVALKYMVMAVPVAILVGFVLRILTKDFKISLEENKHDK